MSINEDWDVEQHKVEYESDEHWELRRNFLLAHKDKFSEDVLVCLAQVFVNVELLGCRYPQETMDLVKELSEDIAAKYREKQKKKLQRTFVEASEAASSKVKGSVARTSTVTEEQVLNTPNNDKPDTIKHEDEPIKENQKDESDKEKQKNKPNKKKKDKEKLIKRKAKDQTPKKCNTQGPVKKSFSIMKKIKLDTEESSKRLETEEDNKPYGDIVLWERPNDIPQNILGNSVNISGGDIEWKCTYKEKVWECSIYINSKQIASCTNPTKKIVKTNAAAAALEELRKYYYTVKVKQFLSSKTNVTVVTTKEIKPQDSTSKDKDWKSFSCGEELMRRMGWTGGGLGKSEQGEIEPMSAVIKSQISRQGLGLKANSCTTKEIKTKCRSLFNDFLQSTMKNDIVFSDFTGDERAVIHQVARAMGLKSRSYGPTGQRKLIVSRKVDVRTLVKELKKLGGDSEKYELVKPTDEKITPTSTDS